MKIIRNRLLVSVSLLLVALSLSLVINSCNNPGTTLPFSGVCLGLKEVSFVWDGVDNPEDSDSDYDSYFTYTLPWTFYFYGKPYNQITIDSNGNIWFEYNSYDDSFDLPTGGGHGPVIAAWNDYLSSYDYGEYKVQHKTNPDRVVVEWDTETYDDYSGGCPTSPCPNDFEIVLFKDGKVRIDYRTFGCSYCDDSGSGISKGDGTNYISITDRYGYVYNLAGRSFLYCP